ncbi:MAG: 50S ribosomal protein L24 [Candidatus Nanoarchaeia archaeon]|nr:50S ribosomal protein L24 [Candidatus Nanoarchaeia archaeon]
MKSIFSLSWLRSIKPNKQRKFRTNAPLHIKGEFLNAHLSKELRAKENVRSLRVRKGDKVKVLRGQFKSQSGVVEKVSVSKSKLYITGVALTKRDGSKSLYPIDPSNVMILELFKEDKKRLKNLKKSD